MALVLTWIIVSVSGPLGCVRLALSSRVQSCRIRIENNSGKFIVRLGCLEVGCIRMFYDTFSNLANLLFFYYVCLYLCIR